MRHFLTPNHRQPGRYLRTGLRKARISYPRNRSVGQPLKDFSVSAVSAKTFEGFCDMTCRQQRFTPELVESVVVSVHWSPAQVENQDQDGLCQARACPSHILSSSLAALCPRQEIDLNERHSKQVVSLETTKITSDYACLSVCSFFTQRTCAVDRYRLRAPQKTTGLLLNRRLLGCSYTLCDSVSALPCACLNTQRHQTAFQDSTRTAAGG